MSQCVADYTDRIKDVEALLANHPNELKFYQSLTPGYQKIKHVIFFCETRKHVKTSRENDRNPFTRL